MKYAFLGFGAVILLGAAVAFSDSTRPTAVLAVQSADRNPWTHTRLNAADGEFQFAIVSDRTGGHRANIFSQAVERLNLLQPEFVLSVGDLIEGGRKTPAQLDAEWQEFDALVNRLQMPFFYVPGNHDAGNEATAKHWREKYGRSYYHFVYRNVLFLCLNSEDPPGAGVGRFGAEQIAYARQALAENSKVRWTIVAFHKPVWTAPNLEKTGLPEVEKALGDRPYTVFVGHVHRYQKFVRNGRNYYQLATTGGGSKMRGLDHGEFDHVVWVTMKQDGPVLANVLIDSVLAEDLKRPETNESGVSTEGRLPCQPVRGVAYFDGMPPVGAYVVLQPTEPQQGRRSVRADGLVAADGSFTLSTYTANDGVPEGKYVATVVWRQPFRDANGKPGPNRLPARYADPGESPLKVEIKAGTNDLVLELKR
jgi:serine/threonine-protein phosphatase CPPED1